MKKYLRGLITVVLILIIFNIALEFISVPNTMANIVAIIILFVIIPLICYLWKK